MNENELKPVRCGCGGEAKVDTKLVSCAPVERKRVYCSKCYISTEWMKSESEAIQAWNRAMGITEKSSTVERTAKVESITLSTNPKNEVYKCSKCGQYFHRTLWSVPVRYCPSCGCRLEWE